MRIDAIAIGNDPPRDVNVIVEVPLGGQPIKYEMDKEAGTLVVDRFLYTPMSYPGNYGFVPHTLSDDGDPIDVLVCNSRQLVPGCVINVRPIGVLVMEDNAGQDEKVVAVPSHALTKRWDHVSDHSDLPEITLQQAFTSVTVPDGGTVLLGGFRSQNERRYESFIPLVGRLPIVKNLFRRKAYLSEKRSLYILLRAEIVDLRSEERELFN